MYELFEHTADLGLRASAASLEALLVETGRGLLTMLVANPAVVRPVQERIIEISAEEPAYLVFDWLSELLFAFEAEKMLLSEFDLQLTAISPPSDASGTPQRAFPTVLRAVCRGEPMDAARHEMEHEVKAITYHGLRVEQTAAGWEAEVIVDI